jgi:hypothetical protein
MKPTTRQLLESIVNALEAQVMPGVEDKWAASVLRSTTQLLSHLALRVESEGRILTADNADVRAVLETCMQRLAGSDERSGIAEVLNFPEPEPYDTVGLAERNEQYQTCVERMLRHAGAVDSGRDAESNAALRAYLRRRLAREHDLFFPVFTGPPF